jgi:transcriptional regulator with XRE-family HTH domain
MEGTRFGKVLAKERRRLGLSLRKLAEAASLNPGYVSRLENGAVTPEGENLLKLADALAKTADPDPAKRGPYRIKLAIAAGREPQQLEEIAAIKEAFTARLKREGLPERAIEPALKSVSLAAMARVVNGEESLMFNLSGNSELAEQARSRGEEVVIIPRAEHEFSAGDRAEIRVKDILKPEQQEQLRIIARLIKNIVG